MALGLAEVIQFPKGGLREVCWLNFYRGALTHLVFSQLDLSCNPIGDAACARFAKSLVTPSRDMTTSVRQARQS